MPIRGYSIDAYFMVIPLMPIGGYSIDAYSWLFH
jgi:hypothetical protein